MKPKQEGFKNFALQQNLRSIVYTAESLKSSLE